MRKHGRSPVRARLNQLLTGIICCSLLVLQTHAQQRDSILQTTPLRFSPGQLYVPGVLMVSGIVLTGKSPHSPDRKVADSRNERIPDFHTHADDYLAFTPLALTYGFEAIGMRPKTDILNRSVIVLKSELLLLVSVGVLKNATHILRPDSSHHNSFPSGHTAQAFAGAALLSQEYGYRYKWVPWVAYGMATSVGVLRIANNKHYLSDVLMGAGLGILSTKAAYWTHRYKWGKKQNLTKLL